MAYMVSHLWRNGTRNQYQEALAKVHPASGLPKGQIYHAAGITDDGVLIFTVWDSKESLDTFIKDVMIPSKELPGGFVGVPEEIKAESINIQH
jgi:hypothetical protein